MFGVRQFFTSAAQTGAGDDFSSTLAYSWTIVKISFLVSFF